MFEAARFLSTGFFSGYAPLASGTAGSFIFVLLWMLAHALGVTLSLPLYLLSAFALFVAGSVATSITIRGLRSRGASEHSLYDPSLIVVDEWVGQMLALAPVAGENMLQITAAFLIFRFFDITKLWPCTICEEIPGSLGIMLDDIVAGLYAWAALVLLSYIFPL